MLSKNEIIVVLFGALFMVLFGRFLFLAADTPSQGIDDNLIPIYWYQVGVLFVSFIIVSLRFVKIRFLRIDWLAILLVVLWIYKAQQVDPDTMRLDEFAASAILFLSLRLVFQAWVAVAVASIFIVLNESHIKGYIGRWFALNRWRGAALRRATPLFSSA